MADTVKLDDPWQESASDVEALNTQLRADLRIALHQIKESSTHFEPQYKTSSRDIAYLQSYQWDEKTRKFRDAKDKATISAPLIASEYRKSMGQLLPGDLDITVTAVNSKGDDRTDTIKSVMDYIMRQSKAASHIKKARIDQTAGGIGWLSVDYVETEGFSNGDIIVTSPKSFASVLIDPFSNEPDYSDARYSFDFREISFLEGKTKYGEKFTKMSGDDGMDMKSSLESIRNTLSSTIDNTANCGWWFSNNNNSVKVATWYRRVPEETTTYLLDLGDNQRELTEEGWKLFKKKFEEESPDQELPEVKTKTEMAYRVDKYVLVPWAILEGPVEFFTTEVPHVPVLGFTLNSGALTTSHGLIHDGVEIQETLNYTYSEMVEKSAKNKAIALFGIGEMGDVGLSKVTENAGMEFWTYDKTADGTGQSQGVQVITSPDNGTIQAQQLPLLTDILKMATSGGSEQGGQITSGEQLQIILDQKQETFGEINSNFKMSLESLGRKLIKGISRVYQEGDIVRILHVEDGEKRTGMHTINGDLSMLKYDISIRVKSSSLTQKRERQKLLGQMVDSGDPITRSAAMPEFIAASDVASSDSILMSWARSMVSNGQSSALPPELKARVIEEQAEQGEIEQQIEQRAQQLAEQKLQELLGDTAAKAIISQAEANVVTAQARTKKAEFDLQASRDKLTADVRKEELQVVQEAHQSEQDRLEALTQALKLQQEIMKTQQQGFHVQQTILDQFNTLVESAQLQDLGINQLTGV